MRKIVSAAAMREIDRLTVERYAMPSLLLMEQAATATMRAIDARFDSNLSHKKVCVLCGGGNNGGDGATLARLLWLAGARVQVVLFGRVDQTQGDALTNFEIVRRLAGFASGSISQPPPLTFTECETLAAWQEITGAGRSYDIVVDALFGTGLSRPLDTLPAKVVEHVALLRRARERANATYPLIVALDIPSGLNADRAEINGLAMPADLTVTFTAPKAANVLPPAAYHNGELVVASIGSPAKLIEETASNLFLVEREDARRWLVQTRYAPDSYKNTHGHALVIAGSRDYTGAPVLCGDAAMHSGAGLVTVATAASAHQAVSARLMPEVMTASLPETSGGAISIEALNRVRQLAARANVIAIGPGLSSTEDSTRHFVRAVVENRRTPVVIDADALNALAPWPADVYGSEEFPLILTPHIGEMRRLIGAHADAPLADRVTLTREFASAHNLILVLKGSRTLIAAPDQRVFINPTGNAGLGTAGAGDTLTGIIAGFNAQAFGALKNRPDALEATIAAVYVSSLAGDMAAREKGMRALVASDIRKHFSAAIRMLDAEGEMPR
jgi:NAD(P)H-hydrate epimerase